jgi:hypothetical protein
MTTQEEDEAIAVVQDFVPTVGFFSLDEIKLAVDLAGAVAGRRQHRAGHKKYGLRQSW